MNKMSFGQFLLFVAFLFVGAFGSSLAAIFILLFSCGRQITDIEVPAEL